MKNTEKYGVWMKKREDVVNSDNKADKSRYPVSDDVYLRNVQGHNGRGIWVSSGKMPSSNSCGKNERG